MTPSDYARTLATHARKRLIPALERPDAERIAIWKKFLELEQHRLLRLHRGGAGGREVARSRALLIETLLRHLLRAALSQHPQPSGALALVAIGGFGRGELSPCSDVDIMFLHGGGNGNRAAAIEPVVQRVLYPLWDLGLKVGHSTRSIDEAVAQANQDMESKTSLIEARLLEGDAALFDRFWQTLLRRCVRGHVEEYLAARLQDQQQRHEKYGNTVFLQEPDVKNGCGGLRDYHNFVWMAFFKHGELGLPALRRHGLISAAEHRALDEAYEFILRVRNALHFYTGRPSDVITLSVQPHLAADLGYRQHDVLRRTEAFMRDYYRHARELFLLTEALAERMALREPKRSRLAVLWRKRAAQPEHFDGFHLRNGWICADEAGVFRRDPLRLLRVFRHLQQRGVELCPELRHQIRENLDLIDRRFRHSPEARDTFLSLLKQKGQVGRALRRMHETEVLGRYLPEFGRLTCLVQHEFFHRYTADEHTLQMIEHLDRVLDATTPPHCNYRKLFQQTEHAHILYLAILLHDVGKAANVDRHAEASVEAARQVADRLKLSADETALLLFLVRDHLKLSMLSQRRDLDDPATIEAAVRVVKNEVNLDLLQLLTFADAAGTSAKAWSDWKEALLWGLYHRTRQALAGPERSQNILSRRIEQLYREVSTRLKNELPLEEIYSHCELMPASYYINTSAEQMVEHLRVIHQFLARQFDAEKPDDALMPVVAWHPHPAEGFTQVAVATWDRFGLFSKICGAFAYAGLNILRAQIYTRGDHVVLDIFDVCDRDLNAVTDRESMSAAEHMLQRMLTHREVISPDELLARIRATRPRLPRLEEVAIPTEIRFDNEISKSRTVIEIQTEDRLGLLYVITHTLSDLNLDISFAKITTEKGAAFDTFYVQDHHGQKITDPQRLETIRNRLIAALDQLAR
ncbi:MAG: [protein-PII] uridylyltransferase [Verrucomicrobiae bacterium]|nr:[protein-PII] uridylyltransferase [Verrucomicrobiae bacterium]